MIFDGFIVLDTREPRAVTNAMPVANATRESGYDGPIPSPSGSSSGPSAPSPVPTPGISPSTGGKSNLGEYVTPATIVAGASLLSGLAGMFQKTGEQKNLKSVCGRKPLFNAGGKKDKYRACVDNYIFRQSQPAQTAPMGMDQGTKTLITVLSILALIILIIVVIVAMKKKNTATSAA